MPDKQKPILATANDDGTVHLAVGESIARISSEDAAKVAIMILRASQEASYKVGFQPKDVSENDALNNVIGFVPDAIGATGRDETTPPCLVVAVGHSRFAIALEEQALASLSRTLQTLSAGEDKKN